MKRNRGYYRYQRKRWIAKRMKQWRSVGWHYDLCQYHRPVGSFSKRDPWDCGKTRCGICHLNDPGRRSRDKREWQSIENSAW